jgi:hypothetical protein
MTPLPRTATFLIVRFIFQALSKLVSYATIYIEDSIKSYFTKELK